LFRRHVIERADQQPFLGGTGVGDPRDAEVEDLDRALVVDHHVRRLHIAVDDAGSMRVGQAVGDVRDPLENPQHGDPLRAAHVLGKRVPLDVLHGDERLPLVLADVEHRNDVPMTQSRDRARFAGETRTQILVTGFFEQLDGDLAFQEGIPGEQKFTHAALANSVDDLKAPDSVRQSVHRGVVRPCPVRGERPL
jgi:hypothetical protein